MFSTKTIAVAVVALFAQSCLAATDCSRTYTVKEGDVCDQISAANQVSTYQLAVVNQGVIDSTCSNLVPGEQICLATTPDEDCTDIYVVKQDDSCAAIESMSNLNSTIFSANNPQINEQCDNIYVGEVLCVASTVKVPPAPAGAIPATTIPATAAPAVPSATKAVPATPKAPEPATTQAPEPATTKAPAPATTKAPAPSHTVQQDDDDDENLPFCDEI
jgi:LysM repeat protein